MLPLAVVVNVTFLPVPPATTFVTTIPPAADTEIAPSVLVTSVNVTPSFSLRSIAPVPLVVAVILTRSVSRSMPVPAAAVNSSPTTFVDTPLVSVIEPIAVSEMSSVACTTLMSMFPLVVVVSDTSRSAPEATTSVAIIFAPSMETVILPLAALTSNVTSSAPRTSKLPAVLASAVIDTPPVPMALRKTPPDVAFVAVSVVALISTLPFAPVAPMPVTAVSVTTSPTTSEPVPATPSVIFAVRAVSVTFFPPASSPTTEIDPPTIVTLSPNDDAVTATAPVPSSARPSVIDANVASVN